MLCPSCHTGNRDDAKFCKGCGKALQPLQESLPHVQQQVEQVEDPALEPTLIISPEKMMAYHQRHWEEAMAQEAAPEPYAYASSIGGFEAIEEQEEDNHQAPTSAQPGPLSLQDGGVEPAPAHHITDLPSFLMPAQNEHDAIPIPPPPPPPPEGRGEQSGTESGEAREARDEAMYNAGYIENAGYPEMETSHTMPDSSEHASSEQAEQAEPVNQDHNEDNTEDNHQEQHADAGGGADAINRIPTFAVKGVGTRLQDRYEINEVIADNPQEHIYQVVDHQGYQRCWNCASENNTESDDFCTDCGASLRDAVYIMHEYSTEQSKEDTPVLHGTIINTFVDEGYTYVIEQIQPEQNVFANGVHLLAASSSDAGNVRRSDPNEDSALVLQLQRIHESFSSPVGVYIVADGMGGHDNGQLASRMTINAIAERMVRDLLLAPLAEEKEGVPAAAFEEESLVALLHDAIEDANTALCQVNARNKTDMGSTLTGFMIVGQHAFIVNVGDSRTYMIRGQQIYQLTTDHSLVGQLVASGVIEPDEVYTHPQRSQIYRSLGDKLNTPIDIFKQQLQPGDKLLSCCDGLWEMVRNPQIESTLNNAADPQTACQQLIDLANENGGEDNITSVVVYVQ